MIHNNQCNNIILLNLIHKSFLLEKIYTETIKNNTNKLCLKEQFCNLRSSMYFSVGLNQEYINKINIFLIQKDELYTYFQNKTNNLENYCMYYFIIDFLYFLEKEVFLSEQNIKKVCNGYKIYDICYDILYKIINYYFNRNNEIIQIIEYFNSHYHRFEHEEILLDLKEMIK